MDAKQRAHEKNMKGLVLLRQGEYEGAVAAFDEAIALDPWDGYFLLNRARAYRELSREVEADAEPGREPSPDAASPVKGPGLGEQGGKAGRALPGSRLGPPPEVAATGALGIGR